MTLSAFARTLSMAGVLVVLSGCKSFDSVDLATQGVNITKTDGVLEVTIDGEPFTQYHYLNVSRPYLYPVFGPGGLPMTRDWPMNDGPNDEHDHAHHKSLWFSFGDINGVDFWSEMPNAGKTVHDGFIELKSGKNMGVIKTRQKLVAKDGKQIATDVRTIRVYNTEPYRMMDYEVTLTASQGDLVLGDTKEGTMAIRLAPTLRLKGKVGQGHIVNSEGVRDGDTWGKRADWCDYYGPVKGHVVGVAIFDNPKNPRHPTWWHVRDYGLFAANPVGEHDFEKKPKGVGDLKIKAGDSLTFRYRFYFHQGTTEEADVAGRYKAYAAGD